MRNSKRLFLAGILLLALVGCLPVDPSLPTALPPEYLPTAIALTLQAAGLPASPSELGVPSGRDATSGRVVPTASPLPVNSLPAITQAPSRPTPQPTPGGDTPTPPVVFAPTAAPGEQLTPTRTATASPQPSIPLSDIQILRPGSMSRVVSPVSMAAYLRPGTGGKVRIELFGEDGRALLRLVQVYYAAPNARVHIYEDLAYEISAAAELGRLVITTEDGFGRPVAVNSVDLVLLGMGEADPNPSGEEQQAIVIRKPARGALIQGGTLVLSGEARPVDSGLLRVELVSEEGKVVGQRAATVGEPGPNGYGAFQVEVPYQVDSFTRARLVISAGGAPMSEIRWLASVEVLLGP